jgi:hypothetical protein
MNLGIWITANNRPEYLKTVLDSWKQANWRGRQLGFRVEPGNQEVINLCSNAGLALINEEQLGALGNPYWTLHEGFERGNDFVVLGEDDSIVAPDVLDYFEDMMVRYRHDTRVLAICSFTHRKCGKPWEVFRQTWFASVVWGTWRNRWDSWFKDNWGFDYFNGAWDHRIVNYLQEDGFVCVFPCVSRSQHIGRYDGTHMIPEDFERMQADEIYIGKSWPQYKEVFRWHGSSQ